MSKESPIRVVSAVIVRYGRVLMTQRDPEGSLPLQWGCPGSKVESWETDLEAMSRELLEGIGCAPALIEPGSAPPCQFDPPITSHSFLCTHYSVVLPEAVKPKLLVGVGMGWFLPNEFSNLKLTPATMVASRYWARKKNWEFSDG